jgi:membrane protein
MPLNVTILWSLIRQTMSSWLNDYAPSMGAALAYYTLFSLAPLLLIVISVAGLVFGEDAARGEIALQLRLLMGDSGAKAVQEFLNSVSAPTEGAFATAAGVLLVLVGSTTVFAELQDALDRIWRAPVRSQSNGWLTLVRARLLSFGMILAIGFLLCMSLILSTILKFMGRWFEPIFGAWYLILSVADAIGSFLLIATLFALIYKTMPRVRIQWKDVWTGALLTSLLFGVGKFLIGMYVSHSGIITGFGAARSVVIVLLWVYYSAQIFLIGAEFTWVYANTYGSRKPAVAKLPEILSVPVTQTLVAEQ